LTRRADVADAAETRGVLGHGLDRVSGFRIEYSGVAALPVYQAQFGFSATTLTALFAMGRRGVIAAGLAVGAAGCTLFLV
jgi:hypothetical protein